MKKSERVERLITLFECAVSNLRYFQLSVSNADQEVENRREKLQEALMDIKDDDDYEQD